jgi:AcrR family transcriptional regulator
MRADRRVPLTRERVLEAAIALADEGGIESLSMRKLGQALGVEAMSLYNHVANKDDILDGIADQVLAQIQLPRAGGDWEAAIWRCATSAHDALTAHPWACNPIMSNPRILPARLRYIDSVLGCLREAGFSAAATYHGYHALDSHILGFTLWEAGHSISEEDLAGLMAFVPRLSAEGYPYLAEHAEQHFAGIDDQGEFEFGLRLIVDGLKRELAVPPAAEKRADGARRGRQDRRHG